MHSLPVPVLKGCRDYRVLTVPMARQGHRECPDSLVNRGHADYRVAMARWVHKARKGIRAHKVRSETQALVVNRVRRALQVHKGRKVLKVKPEIQVLKALPG